MQHSPHFDGNQKYLLQETHPPRFQAPHPAAHVPLGNCIHQLDHHLYEQSLRNPWPLLQEHSPKLQNQLVRYKKKVHKISAVPD